MKTIRIFVFVTLFASCISEGKEALDYRQNIVKIEGEMLPIDCFIGNPYCMTTIDDILYYYDRFEGKTISEYDLKKDRCLGRFLSEGQGPGEIIPPIDFMNFSQENELIASERNTGAIYHFNIPKLTVKNKKILSPRSFKIHKIKDYYIGEGIFNSKRFCIYNSYGEHIRTDGKYPFGAGERDSVSAFILYQGHYAAHPAQNRFAVCSWLCDNLQFYEVNDDKTILIKEYASRDIKARYENTLIVDDDCIVNYTWAFATEKYCYILYSGKTNKENKGRSGWGNYIIVFDWDGNYVKTFEPEQEVRYFCVDKSDSNIYAIVCDKTGEYGIMKFKIE